MYEIVYTSAARRLFDPQQLGELLTRARQNNQELSVSGILLYQDGAFLQLLEGEREVLRALFAKISQDPRHDRVRVVRERDVAGRSFASWTMGFVLLDPHLSRVMPMRHGLSSNGSLIGEDTEVLGVLEAFRSGRWNAYISG